MDDPDDDEKATLAKILRLASRTSPAERVEIAERLVRFLSRHRPRLDEAHAQAGALGDHQRDRADYQGAFVRVAERVEVAAVQMAADEKQAALDLEALLDAPDHAARLARVEVARRRFRSPQLADLLMAHACTRRGKDPREAVQLLELARKVAEKISPVTYGSRARERLLVRVEAHRANARRVACELRAADALWTEIHDRLRREPLGDPLEQGEILSLEASLRTDQRRFDEAEELLNGARRCLRRAGDRQGHARLLIQLGNLRFFQAEYGAAIDAYSRAAADLDAEAEPYLMARHNLAESYVELGEPAVAARIVAGLRDRYAAYPEDHRIARGLPWLQGRIALAARSWSEAEPLLHRARNGFVKDGLGFNAALVSLDLADLYRAQGKAPELRQVAELMAPLFAAQDVHREAMAALLVFQEAVRRERADVTFVAALRRYLRQARHDPSFRFEPPQEAPTSES